MKKIIGLALLSLLLCACQMKPLVTEVEGNIVVVNSEQYKIADNFHLAAVAEMKDEHQTRKSYIYNDLEGASWVIVVENIPNHKTYYFGKGTPVDLMESWDKLYFRTFNLFEKNKWRILLKEEESFKFSEFNNTPVDMITYQKLVSEKKSIWVILMSAVDSSNPLKSSHIDEVQQCFTKMPHNEGTD